MTAVLPLLQICAGGDLRLNFHRGQTRAWQSKRRVVAVIAGAQSGKTSFGPLWLQREMQDRGPGDYLVVAPTYSLFEKNALPAFLFYFKQLLQLGEYKSRNRTFVFSRAASERMFGSKYDPLITTTVIFGYAENPDSLESMTVKACWCDEAGQKAFKLASWEAIQRRVAINEGRILITTTPYSVTGWLKDKIVLEAQNNNPDIDLIRFDSTENPAFSKDEYKRLQATMPTWKFNLFYRGILSRPVGLIYDCYDERLQSVPRFALPAAWPRFLGMDFGTQNTAGIFLAQEPGTSRLYLYREYKAGGKAVREHVKDLLEDERGIPTTVGGSLSENDWRAEFKSAGLPIRPPDIKEVEVGLARVYASIKERQLYIFDDCEDVLAELLTYAYKLDADGLATTEIADKAKYHRLDALRYIIGWIRKTNSSEPFRSASRFPAPPPRNNHLER